jgi:hypothetical protein
MNARLNPLLFEDTVLTVYSTSSPLVVASVLGDKDRVNIV